MYVGVDYYPEHWPRERWETDARLMQEAGFNVVRLGEFAWAFLEPEEGRFVFDWLDEAIALLGAHGISVLLGTPTAAMPAWVPRRYPEVIATRVTGQPFAWGVRKHNCLTSGSYRLLSERITRALAEHFAETPHVIGWQTDNEFGGPVCYCQSCRAGFHDWLHARYGTLEELNRGWGTHFWGQRYGQWSEVQFPEGPESAWEFTGTDALGTHNPSLCLDFLRYQSWLNVRFQHDQVTILREHCPKHFITHNLMGLFSDLNYYDLADDLDVVSWDNYPIWADVDIPHGSSAAAAVMRGLKRRNFWIMEQTAGPGGWSSFGRSPRPGEIRKISYQQVANGADAIVWFRWRTCTAGREQYWHGLLGHDGRPLRRYREAAQFAREFHRLAPDLEGTEPRPKIAIVYDYENIWALRIQPAFAKNTYHQAMMRYFSALVQTGLSVDMVKPGQDLSGYRLVIAPELTLLPDSRAEWLLAYVKHGGVLVADTRLGMKDETNLCHARTLPGRLSEALGISIEEYEAPAEGIEYPVVGGEALPGRYTAIRYMDWITPQGAEVLAGYDQWHLQSFAAATRHDFGQGTAFYLGAVMKEPEFYRRFLHLALTRAGLAAMVTPPHGVEVTLRERDSHALLFLLNHTEETQRVKVPAGQPELLSGDITGASLELAPYGVAVVKLARDGGRT